MLKITSAQIKNYFYKWAENPDARLIMSKFIYNPPVPLVGYDQIWFLRLNLQGGQMDLDEAGALESLAKSMIDLLSNLPDDNIYKETIIDGWTEGVANDLVTLEITANMDARPIRNLMLNANGEMLGVLALPNTHQVLPLDKKKKDAEQDETMDLTGLTPQQVRRLVTENMHIEDRVRYGKALEDEIAKSLSTHYGFEFNESTKSEDLSGIDEWWLNHDSWMTEAQKKEQQQASRDVESTEPELPDAPQPEAPTRRVSMPEGEVAGSIPIQLKYRDTGDDLRIEVWENFYEQRRHVDWTSRSQYYFMLSEPATEVYMMKSKDAKDVIEELLEKAREAKWDPEQQRTFRMVVPGGYAMLLFKKDNRPTRKDPRGHWLITAFVPMSAINILETYHFNEPIQVKDFKLTRPMTKSQNWFIHVLQKMALKTLCSN